MLINCSVPVLENEGNEKLFWQHGYMVRKTLNHIDFNIFEKAFLHVCKVNIISQIFQMKCIYILLHLGSIQEFGSLLIKT